MSDANRFARYSMKVVKDVYNLITPGVRLPLLRLAQDESLTLTVARATAAHGSVGKEIKVTPSSPPDIQVHWLGEMPMPAGADGVPRARGKRTKVACCYLLQVGFASPLGIQKPDANLAAGSASISVASFVLKPSDLATPAIAR